MATLHPHVVLIRTEVQRGEGQVHSLGLGLFQTLIRVFNDFSQIHLDFMQFILEFRNQLVSSVGEQGQIHAGAGHAAARVLGQIINGNYLKMLME